MMIALQTWGRQAAVAARDAAWDAAWGAARDVLDLLLPPECLTCDQPVAEPGLFCPACFAATAFIGAPCCDHCGRGFTDASQGFVVDGRERGVCAGCAGNPPPWRQARAPLGYDAQARRLVLAFKHGDRTELAGALAAMMQRAGAALLQRAEVIVPVPLHRRRLLARRYNQAALLALALQRLSGRPALPDLLRRTRHTVSLGHLDATQREAVVAGAFVVRPHRAARMAGRRVLLVDDVMTTGATAAACTLALLAAGAASVDVLVAARVPDRRIA